jgi:YggT family protein
MGRDYLSNPFEFLITTLASLFILAVMLRFLLAMVRADFYNPLSQVLVKLTNPVLQPLRRIIPGWGGVDLASLLLMLAAQMLALALVLLLRGAAIQPFGLLLWSIAELLGLLINIYLGAIFILVIVSWINPHTNNPAISLIYSLTEPLLAPARRLLPPLAGLDLSPLVVLLALQVAKMLLLPPLLQLALGAG